MVVKSWIIYHQLPLLGTTEARKQMQGSAYQKLGYSDHLIAYFGTAVAKGLKLDASLRERKVNRVEIESLISRLQSQVKVGLTSLAATGGKVYSNATQKNFQEYYMDGPIVNLLSSRGQVPKGQALHQFASIKGDTFSKSSALGYAVGVWGNASSNVAGNKLVGVFATVSGIGAGADSQLVGQEVDVINNLPKNFSGKVKSSVGQQLVTIGTHNSTAATEIISDGVSKWENAIMVTGETLTSDATVIGVSQKTPVRIGLDFGNTPFSDSAIRISPSSAIKFESTDYMHPATINLTKDGFLQLKSGENGFAVKSNDGINNLIYISNQGEITFSKPEILYETASGETKRIDLTAISDTKQPESLPIWMVLAMLLVSFLNPFRISDLKKKNRD